MLKSIPEPKPNRLDKKIGRITGPKNFDVFWISYNSQVVFNCGAEWFSQADGYITDSLLELFGRGFRLKNIFLSAGYRGKNADSQSYYDIYDCDWSTLAIGDTMIHITIGFNSP